MAVRVIGTKLSERYEITGELGRGGMGVVYRARDASLGREVAIKLLLRGSDDTAAARFAQEARAAAKLRHPGIVSVHEVGEHEGRPYIVMDLIAGQRLDEAMAKGLPPRRAAEVVRDVARALAYAHGQGIVHRD